MADALAHPAQRPLRWPDELLDVFDVLRELDAPLYVVGGAVRDAFMGLPVKDLDLATPASGVQVARQIANRLGGAVYPLDAERETGRAILELATGRLVIDVAQFRAQALTDDLRDRDFTMNALAVDVRGDTSWVIDPTGGEADLIARRVRRCQAGALMSDPVRVLRGIRMSVQHGFQIERETIREMRQQAAALASASAERVRDELFRILALGQAVQGIKVADALGALGIVLPEVKPLQDSGGWSECLAVMQHTIDLIAIISPARTDQTAAKFSMGMVVMGLDRYRKPLQTHLLMHWADDRSHRALLNLVLLLTNGGSTGLRRARDLPLSNREIERLTPLLKHPDAYRQLGTDRSALTLHRYWRTFGAAGVDLCLLSLARQLARMGLEIDQDAWIAEIELARSLLESYYDHYTRIVEPPSLVDGNGLMAALDLKPGPIVGRLLDAIREAQVQGHVSSADEALALARALLRHGRDGIE